MHPTWQTVLQPTLDSPAVLSLRQFLRTELLDGKVLYPPPDAWFRALKLPIPKVKVVILGQDPYHNPGEANGLCFSVGRNIAIPPSLRNIYTELRSEFGWKHSPEHGDLSVWAHQGVLLLNTVLTVEAHQPHSHSGLGWEVLTDAVVEALSAQDTPVVFMLWGRDAQSKASRIDSRKHLILEAPHPSPLSAYRGFFGTGHFRIANNWLQAQGRQPIDWWVP